MTPEEFREAGHRLVDWIADYRAGAADRPVRSSVEPGWVHAELDAPPPNRPEPLDVLLADLDRAVLPGLTHFQHPSYFAYFPANASLASVLGDLTSSGLGVIGLNWESSPALTELEEITCAWFADLAGLGDPWRGTIHDTASTACLVALLCAREHASGLSQNTGGLTALDEPLVVYCSDQAHSSVTKAALLAGFGFEHVRVLPTDRGGGYALDPAAVEAAIGADLAAGRRPAAVVASLGTTGVTAVDPVAPLVEVARRHSMWVHVDAAMAGSAVLLPELAHLFAGVDQADSLSMNPHKWLGTIIDTSLFFAREPERLVEVMSTNPSYLRTATDGDVTQYRDWGIPLGRRFRALKLWFHLRLDGLDAIRARLRRDLEHARWLAAEVEADPAWRLAAPVNLQTVCVRHEPEGIEGDALDAHTLRWVGAINDGGRAYLTPSMLDGRWMVRVSIGAEPTERHHVEALWALMRAAVEEGSRAA
ncbi:MAG: pyridoxal-dependent decarboxylase [Actinomycetota bacterium]